MSNVVWKVFYKDQLIAVGPSQAEALGPAVDYMRTRNIKDWRDAKIEAVHGVPEDKLQEELGLKVPRS